MTHACGQAAVAAVGANLVCVCTLACAQTESPQREYAREYGLPRPPTVLYIHVPLTLYSPVSPHESGIVFQREYGPPKLTPSRGTCPGNMSAC